MFERFTDRARTAVILAIFQRHARSREARLQVEIARLTYMTPRLREGTSGCWTFDGWSSGETSGGGCCWDVGAWVVAQASSSKGPSATARMARGMAVSSG